MSNISVLLNNILKAVYGREVRQSIHDSIAQCYEDVMASKTRADGSIESVQQKINDCELAASGARTATNAANASASNADASASSANAAASNANASAEVCNNAVSALPNSVTNMFAALGLTIVNGKLCVEVIRE